MPSSERAGAQSPPPSEQNPNQGREAPSSGQMHHEQSDDGEGKASTLSSLSSNPEAPLQKYVKEKTGTIIGEEKVGSVGEGNRGK